MEVAILGIHEVGVNRLWLSEAVAILDVMNTTPSPLALGTKAAARRRNVELCRSWHDRRRAEGKPEPRDVDSAIVAAAAFVLAVPTAAQVAIDVRAMVDVATLFLREKGYTHASVREVVVDRLRPRAEHRDTTRLPNTIGVLNPKALHPPRRPGAEWTERDHEILDRVLIKLRSPNG
jgi:hypothetical protein